MKLQSVKRGIAAAWLLGLLALIGPMLLVPKIDTPEQRKQARETWAITWVLFVGTAWSFSTLAKGGKQ